MRSLAAVVMILACSLFALNTAQGQLRNQDNGDGGDSSTQAPEQQRSPMINTFLESTRPEYATFATSSDLGSVYGGDLRLLIDNPGQSDLIATYSIYVSDHCIKTDDAIMLGSETTVDLPGESLFNESIADVSTGDVELPCGPACLFVNVTSDGMMYGIARAAIMSACNPNGIDLVFEHNIDLTVSYSLERSESIHGKIDDLGTLELWNKGDQDMKPMSRDLRPSVLAFIRAYEHTAEDLEFDCDYDWGGGEYSSTYGYGYTSTQPYASSSTESNRKKRDADTRDKRSNGGAARKKRDAHDAVSNTFDHYFEMRQTAMRRNRQFPECTHEGFMHRDIPLKGGDIIVEPLNSGHHVEIDLSGVMLEAKHSLCSHIHMNRSETDIVSALLVLQADPLHMYNDSSRCDNSVIINITYSCEGVEYSDYDTLKCGLLVDPASNGHEAAVMAYGEPILLYYGNSLKHSYNMYTCANFEYYAKLALLVRWQLLADRYQREAEMNEHVCMEVDSNEIKREKRLIERAIAESRGGRRKKRQTGGNQDGDGDDGMSEFRTLLSDVIREVESAQGDHEHTRFAVCLTQGLKFRYNELKNRIREDDEIHNNMLRLTESAATLIASDNRLREIDDCAGIIERKGDYLNLIIDEGASAELLINALKDNDPKKQLLMMVLELIAQDEEEREQIRDSGFDGKLAEMRERLDSANGTCSGRREESSNSGRNHGRAMSMLMALAKKSLKARSDDMTLGQIPLATCGMSKLQEVLSRGGENFVNMDLKKINRVDDAVDEEIMRMRYVRYLNEVLEEEDLEDYDEIVSEVYRRLNDTMMKEDDRCQAERSVSEEARYRIENRPDTDNYWMMQDGKVYQGIPDVFSPSFGRMNEVRKVLWKPVATCSCTYCDYRLMIRPDIGPVFGNYTTYAPYTWYTSRWSSGSTTPYSTGMSRMTGMSGSTGMSSSMGSSGFSASTTPPISTT